MELLVFLNQGTRFRILYRLLKRLDLQQSSPPLRNQQCAERGCRDLEERKLICYTDGVRHPTKENEWLPLRNIWPACCWDECQVSLRKRHAATVFAKHLGGVGSRARGDCPQPHSRQAKGIHPSPGRGIRGCEGRIL
ncbi:uncharacterized protein LOC134537491 [Bacillus rossius redtenbacheri]|uniref:uncharacterized protein LOC134537491 n=1 Tax=Bacillus rossius redtenbacheri TaxID=93214 RepID=UPI002FDCF72E